MEFYIKSAGFSQDQDYSWKKIEENNQKRVAEPTLVNKFKDFIETEAPSIFIGRESNKLILLVTGMKASKRKDYRDRTIRNSIALIAQEKENEQKIRGIAVLALEGKLENEIDSAIKEGGEWGFEVSYEKIDNIMKASLQTKNSTGTKPAMIGKNSEHNRKIIADELQKSCLPQKTNASVSEILVVVTGIKTEDALKKAGVWRGLSNLVEKEGLSPYESPNPVQAFFPSSQQNRKTNFKFIIQLMISLGVIGLITLWFFWSPMKFLVGGSPSEPTTVVLAAINPGGQYFATVDSDDKVLVQNIQDKTNNPIANKAPIKSVAISSDGSYVVTGDETGNVQLWDVTNKKKIEINSDNNIPNKHEKAVLSVAINTYKNKIKIVSGSADGKVLLWIVNVNNGKYETSITKLWQ